MRPILLEARGVTVRPVLENADFVVRLGESVAILGPPGAVPPRKLLRTFALRDPPDSGALLWHGRLATPPDLSIRLLWGRPPRLLRAIELAVRRRTELLLIGGPAGAPPDLKLLRLLHSLHQRGHSLVLATCDPEAALWCETIYQWKDARIHLLSRTI